MTVIIANKPGQLGNRLVVYSNFICFGKEFGINICNPAFDEYKSYFNNARNRGKILNRLLYLNSYIVARLLDRLKVSNKFIACKHIDWNENVLLDKLEGNQFLFSNVVFVQGWGYRNISLLQKYRQIVLDKFTPNNNFQKQLNEFSLKHFKNDQLLIGVHIRRGDYANFEGGKYFYELEDYYRWMNEVKDCFVEKDIKFLVSTNEKDIVSDLNSTDINFVMAPGHELLDLYTLSKCHYLIGPPSTYTLWASFYGEVPLQMIRSKDHQVEKAKFEVTRYF